MAGLEIRLSRGFDFCMDVLIFLLITFVLAFSVILHEWAHGYIALSKGDPTAKLTGRLTLNPIPHIDIFGTVLLPLLTWFLGHFIIAYAKPVPVNPIYFKSPRRDMMMVAAAGPVMNLLIAILSAIPLRLHQQEWILLPSAIYLALFYAVHINVFLAVLNLIPIPPLDGSRIIKGWISTEAAERLDKIEPYGFAIIMLLFYLDFFRLIMDPLCSMALKLILGFKI